MTKVDSNKTVLVAIVSDTHGFLNSQIADVIRDADIAIHAGDIGDAKVLEAMQPRSGRVVAVAGNNDHPVLWPSTQLQQLELIPQKANIDLPGGNIAVEHGDRYNAHSPDHQSLRDAHPDSRLIVYGHTHKMIVDDESDPWVVNPGAAGNTRTKGGPSCLLLEASKDSWTIREFRFSE
jgi:putative phosphoesterase